MYKSHIENLVGDLNIRILIEKRGEQVRGQNKEYLYRRRRLIISDKPRRELGKSLKQFKETF